MPNRLISLVRMALLALLVTAFSGCGSSVDLYASISESEANELLSVLLDSGIEARKSTSKDGVTVTVNRHEVAKALDILNTQGLPRERFDGMGQIFRKEGLVSSPLEERVRYIYALSQELTNTLSQMDGVLAARVHVVLPEKGSMGEAATPSTAAVFIKHQQGYSLDALKPQMRKLVTHSIPGLTEDRVSIALISAQPRNITELVPQGVDILGIQVLPELIPNLLLLLLIAILLIVLLLALLAWLYFKNSSQVKKPANKRAAPSKGNPETGEAL